ncbi:MAG: PilZ domain-containing protein [Phycisphaeraceae bacterium]
MRQNESPRPQACHARPSRQPAASRDASSIRSVVDRTYSDEDDQPLSVDDALHIERRTATRYPLQGQVTTLAPTTPAMPAAPTRPPMHAEGGTGDPFRLTATAACGFAAPPTRTGGGEEASSSTAGHGPRIASLQLRDISETGLGGQSPRPLDVNAPITVFLPPHGPEHCFELIGTVVRCQPRHDGGYDIGIQFHRPLAA